MPAFPDDPAALDVYAVITPPGGEAFRLNAFFYQPFRVEEALQQVHPDGPPHYLLRYTPAEPGVYEVQAWMRVQGAEAQMLGPAVTFAVTDPEPGARGFWQLDPHSPRYFRSTQSQEPLWPFGINVFVLTLQEAEPGSTLRVMRSAGEDPRELYRRFDAHRQLLLRAVENRIQAIRIRLDSWWLPLEFDASWPGVEGFTLGRYDPAHAWIADQLIDLAEQHGLAVQICTWNPNTYVHWKRFTQGINQPDRAFHIYARDPANAPLIRRRLRYQAARWSHTPSLFLWELFNEIGYTWNDTANFDIHSPFWTRIIDEFREQDPHRRRVTNSRVGVDTKDLHFYLNPNRNQDFLNATKAPELAQPWGSFDPGDGRPFIMSEYGLAGGDEENYPGDTAAHRRHSAREGLWLGWVTHKSGALFWRYNYVLDGDVYPPFAAFIRGEDPGRHAWSALQFDRVAGPEGLQLRGMIGDPVRAFFLVIRTTSSRASDLAPVQGGRYRLHPVPAGNYLLEWWDPVTGAKISTHALTAAGGGLEVAIPDGITRFLAAKVIPLAEAAGAE